jgi:hypothetical protein
MGSACCLSSRQRVDENSVESKNVVKRETAVFFAQLIENVVKINVQSMSLLPYAACYNQNIE